MTAGGVPEEARDEIDRRHRDVVESEARLFEARRKTRVEAVTQYEAAVEAEKAALARGGRRLVCIVSRRDCGRHRASRGERGRAAGARRREHRPRRRAVGCRRERHRGAARRVGSSCVHAPSASWAGRSSAATRRRSCERSGSSRRTRSERVRELIEVLQAAGVDAATPSRRRASSWPRIRPTARPVGAIVEGLEEEYARHERILADLESEIARLDQIYDAEIDRIAAADLAEVMESLLDSLPLREPARGPPTRSPRRGIRRPRSLGRTRRGDPGVRPQHRRAIDRRDRRPRGDEERDRRRRNHRALAGVGRDPHSIENAARRKQLQ